MSIKISVENYKIIHELCADLRIDSDMYNSIKGELAGKLILDLVKLKMFNLGDVLSGKALEDYQEGGKYDCR